ncbi:MAG: biopolymer transporter ExbD [Prevotella sp.]|nr:biopolymer transporter ExbD [Prevotella sp.]
MNIVRRQREVPQLNMASLPDLIFTILFFFMIATHMRNVSPQVIVEEPQGEALSQQPRHSSLYLFMGWADGHEQLQLGEEQLELDELKAKLMHKAGEMTDEEAESTVVILKADRNVPMHVIQEVKQALRESRLQRIYYSASEKRE